MHHYASFLPLEFIAQLFATVNPLPNLVPTWNMAPTMDAPSSVVDGGVIRVNPAMTENLARELPRLTRPSWPSFDQMQTAVRWPSVNAVSRRRRGP